MSNSQWNEDQAIGERALREHEKQRQLIEAAHEPMRRFVELVGRAVENGERITWERHGRFANALSDALRALHGVES